MTYAIICIIKEGGIFMKFMNVLILFITILTLTSCDNSYNKDIHGAVPVYQGMEYIQQESVINENTPSIDSAIDTYIAQIENIPTIDVPKQDNLIYYANPNEEMIIKVSLYNPDGQVILRLVINKVIYQISQFEEGSNSDVIFIKINSGSTSGLKSLRIDEIKYIENVSNHIKDAVFSSDRIIKIAITYKESIFGTRTDESITPFSYYASIEITDFDNLSVISNNSPVLYVFDGQSIMYTKRLEIGLNSIYIPNLKPSTFYEYAIATIYDALDQRGLYAYIAYKQNFTTQDLMELTFDEITPSKIDFSYDLIAPNEILTSSFELYQDNLKIDSLSDTSQLEFSSLTYNTEYTLKAHITYTYDNQIISKTYAYPFKTKDMYDVIIHIYEEDDIHPLSILLHQDEYVSSIYSTFVTSAFLTNLGRLFVWGYNADAELGTGDTQNKRFPVDITSSFDLDHDDMIEHVVMGLTNGAVITKHHRIFIWGAGHHYQFGSTENIYTKRPYEVTSLIEPFLTDGDYVKHLTFGQATTGILTAHGKVIMTGSNIQGTVGDNTFGEGPNGFQPGFKETTHYFNLDPLDYITDLKIGSSSVIALTHFNQVYTYGAHYSMLGYYTVENLNVPKNITHLIPLEDNEVVIDIYNSGRHMIVYTNKGRLLGWGSNRNNQLSKSLPQDDYFEPIDMTDEVLLHPEEHIIDIVLATSSSAFLTNEGRVVFLGESHLASEIELNTIKDIKIAQNHGVVLDDDLNLITWGSNYFGQVGNNSVIDQQTLYTFQFLKPVLRLTLRVSEGSSLSEYLKDSLYSKYDIYLDTLFKDLVNDVILQKDMYLYAIERQLND